MPVSVLGGVCLWGMTVGGVCIVAGPVARVRRMGHLCVRLLAVGGGECMSVLGRQGGHVTRGIVG